MSQVIAPVFTRPRSAAGAPVCFRPTGGVRLGSSPVTDIRESARPPPNPLLSLSYAGNVEVELFSSSVSLHFTLSVICAGSGRHVRLEIRASLRRVQRNVLTSLLPASCPRARSRPQSVLARRPRDPAQAAGPSEIIGTLTTRQHAWARVGFLRLVIQYVRRHRMAAMARDCDHLGRAFPAPRADAHSVRPAAHSGAPIPLYRLAVCRG